jgi:hypothetical protein
MSRSVSEKAPAGKTPAGKTSEQLAVENLIRSIIDGGFDDELLQAQILSLSQFSLSQFINHPSSDPSLEGFTLLHAAYAVGDKKLATFLKEHGADLEAKDVLGETPIDKQERRMGRVVAKRPHFDAIIAAASATAAGGGYEDDKDENFDDGEIPPIQEYFAPPAQTFPAVTTMLSDEDLDNLMPKWLPQEVEYISMLAVSVARMGSVSKMDETKRKTVMITNLNNHFVGFFVDKDAKKIIYFDPAPDAAHESLESFITSIFAEFEVVHSRNKMQTVSEERFTDGSGAPTGEVLQTIDNNHCGRFMWFVMTGLASGKINLGEDGFLNFTVGADSRKIESLNSEKSMQFGNRVDARLQASLRDESERDEATKKSDYEAIFNEVVEKVFTGGTKRKAKTMRDNGVIDIAAVATAGGGGGGNSFHIPKKPRIEGEIIKAERVMAVEQLSPMSKQGWRALAREEWSEKLAKDLQSAASSAAPSAESALKSKDLSEEIEDIQSAASDGKLEVVKTFIEWCPELTSYAFIAAAEAGRFNILNHLAAVTSEEDLQKIISDLEGEEEIELSDETKVFLNVILPLEIVKGAKIFIDQEDLELEESSRSLEECLDIKRKLIAEFAAFVVPENREAMANKIMATLMSDGEKNLNEICGYFRRSEKILDDKFTDLFTAEERGAVLAVIEEWWMSKEKGCSEDELGEGSEEDSEADHPSSVASAAKAAELTSASRKRV